MSKDDQTVYQPARDRRYDALRRIGQQYELGELSDAEFKRLKLQVLHGNLTDDEIRLARVALFVATYTDHDRLKNALDTALDRVPGQWSPVIDGALIVTSPSGAVRIRVEHPMTRPLVRGHVSIAAAVCGLLYPLDTLLAGHRGTPIVASLDTLEAPESERFRLRSIGDQIPRHSTSILAVCWSSASDGLSDTFHDADQLSQHVFGDDIANAIVIMLASNDDISGSLTPNRHH